MIKPESIIVSLRTSVVVMNWVKRSSSVKNEGCSDAHGCSFSSLAVACKHTNTKISLFLAKFTIHIEKKNRDAVEEGQAFDSHTV